MLYVGIGIFIVVILFILLFNSLIKAKAQIENTWSQIDVQLKRRYDLIPNLVEITKEYAKHEKETFQNVIKARNAAYKASDQKEIERANKKISSELKGLFAIAEGYPDLKANKSFQNLQIELVGTEDKIAYARQFFNDSVQRYNEKLLTFPSNLVAKALKYEKKSYFELENNNQRENVKVVL